MRKKVVFLGSKPIGYNCFDYLIAQKDNLNIDIIGVLTKHRKEFSKKHDLTTLAQNNNIPVISSLEMLPSCDILYSVQYHEILKQEHINKASVAAINLHMAPLPEYRGSNQFSFAIIEEKKEFGTTVHLMDARIDHGDILFQSRFPIPNSCWINELYKLTYEASLQLFKETIAQIIEGDYNPTPQQKLEQEYQASLHFRNEINELKQIDLNWDKEKIERYIRATAMPGFEPPYVIIDGQKIYFSQSY